MIKRYGYPFDTLDEENDGAFVLYTDYAKLEAEHKEAVKELVDLAKSVRGSLAMYNITMEKNILDVWAFQLITKWQGDDK